MQAVGLFFNPNRDKGRRSTDTVVVEEILAEIRPVRNLPKAAPRARFGRRLKLSDRACQRGLAVLAGECGQPRRTNASGRELRLEIAKLCRALTHVGLDQ